MSRTAEALVRPADEAEAMAGDAVAHHPGCWREHQACAVARVEQLQALAEELTRRWASGPLGCTCERREGLVTRWEPGCHVHGDPLRGQVPATASPTSSAAPALGLPLAAHPKGPAT